VVNPGPFVLRDCHLDRFPADGYARNDGVIT
jgi:hypothetical protein